VPLTVRLFLFWLPDLIFRPVNLLAIASIRDMLGGRVILWVLNAFTSLNAVLVVVSGSEISFALRQVNYFSRASDI